MQQHIQTIQKKFSQIKKTPKKILRIGLYCLMALTGAAAILAVVDMLGPRLFSDMPMLIKSLFTYGFYLWAELTIGALILDYVFS